MGNVRLRLTVGLMARRRLAALAAKKVSLEDEMAIVRLGPSQCRPPRRRSRSCDSQQHRRHRHSSSNSADGRSPSRERRKEVSGALS